MSIKFFKELEENKYNGGKGNSLIKLKKYNINIPNGYIISSDIFDKILESYKIKEKIENLINSCKNKDVIRIERASRKIQKIILDCEIQEETKKDIFDNFNKLNCEYVIVRSSASSEDTINNSWAGQFDSILGITEDELIESIKKCWASLYSTRAIFYRIKNNIYENISMAVIVQKMIPSEVSGIAFSINPVNTNEEIIIEAVYGIGKTIADGMQNPDKYNINKNTLEIKNKEIKEQKILINNIKNIEIEFTKNNKQKMTYNQIKNISKLILEIEEYYKCPIDIEFGIYKDQIYIFQCRPITTIKNDICNQIIKKSPWTLYVSRKWSWYGENTQIYGTQEKYQMETQGIYIPMHNYLILNGDEYFSQETIDEINKTFDNLFENDINIFEKIANIQFKICDEIYNYINKIKSIDFTLYSFEELKEEFKKFNELYIKTYAIMMNRPDNYLDAKLKKLLENEEVEDEQLNEIIKKVEVCSNDRKIAYTEEHLDLLEIAKQRKNGEDITDKLNKHMEKYSWLKIPIAQEANKFDKIEYLDRIENIVNPEEKIEHIKNIRNKNDREFEIIINKYNYNKKLIKIMYAVRKFILLRSYVAEKSDYLLFEAKEIIFKEISQRTHINCENILMLNDNEIIYILERKGEINEEILENMKKRIQCYLISIINKNVTVYFGEKATELKNKIENKIKVENINVEADLYGDIAREGLIRGKVIVIRQHKDVYKVNKGDIVVASMTMPNYISALEKASGFITDEGGITCHAAILSRELDVPCIVGTQYATAILNNGDLIELDAYNGIVRKITN